MEARSRSWLWLRCPGPRISLRPHLARKRRQEHRIESWVQKLQVVKRINLILVAEMNKWILFCWAASKFNSTINQQYLSILFVKFIFKNPLIFLNDCLLFRLFKQPVGEACLFYLWIWNKYAFWNLTLKVVIQNCSDTGDKMVRQPGEKCPFRKIFLNFKSCYRFEMPKWQDDFSSNITVSNYKRFANIRIFSIFSERILGLKN